MVRVGGDDVVYGSVRHFFSLKSKDPRYVNSRTNDKTQSTNKAAKGVGCQDAAQNATNMM